MVCLIALSIAVFLQLRRNDDDKVQQVLSYNTHSMAKYIESITTSQLLSVDRMAARWNELDLISEKAWRRDAHNYARDLMGIERIAVLNKNLDMRWEERNALEYDADEPDVLKKHLSSFTSLPKDQLVWYEKPGDIPDHMILFCPLMHGAAVTGYIMAEFDSARLLKAVVPPLTQSYYNYRWYAGNDDDMNPPAKDLSVLRHIRLGNTDIMLEIQPRQSLLEMFRTTTPLIVLGFSLVLSFMTSLLFYYSQNALMKKRELREKSQRIQENEKELRLILHSASIGKALVSAQGQWLSVNPAICRFLGYEEEELLGTDFQTVTHPEDLGKDISQVRKMLARELEYYQMEKRYIRKDGRIVWGLLSVSLLWNDDGTPKYFISQVQDITKLRYAEEKLRTISDQSSEPHLIFTHADGIIDCNAAALKILGLADKSQLIGRSIGEISPPMQPDGLSSLAKAPLTYIPPDDGTEYKFEWAHQKANGDECIVEVTLKPIAFESQEAILAVWYDLSERKQAEEDREALIARLETTNSELDRFAYVASHDLQEPLRTVCSFIDILQNDYSKALDTTGNKYLNIVVSAARRMHALIEDMLEYARVNSGTDSYENFDANKSIDYVLDSLKDATLRSRATITVGKMPTLFNSPLRFSILMQNLISNGIKYKKADVDPVIHISAEDMSELWLFKVQDNGIGIKTEYAKQIFDPFKRLHTKEEYPGTGIGLSICRKIVESGNGNIWVESEAGKGSAFFFTIPKTVPAPLPARVAAAAE